MENQKDNIEKSKKETISTEADENKKVIIDIIESAFGISELTERSISDLSERSFGDLTERSFADLAERS